MRNHRYSPSVWRLEATPAWTHVEQRSFASDGFCVSVRRASVGIPSDLSIGNVGENLTLPRPSSAQIVPVDSTRRARSTHTRAGK